PQDLEGLWHDLGSDDASQAYRAIWDLAAVPRQSLPFLGERLQAAWVPSERLERLIQALNDDSFAVRERATAALLRLRDHAEPLLRKALKEDSLPVESRQRIDRILDKVGVSPQRLQAGRALAALEYMGSDGGTDVLADLAKGPPETWVTHEASLACTR